MSSPHLRSIPAGSAPGALYVRIVTDTNVVLGAHALRSSDIAAAQADYDHVAAFRWVEQHPDGRCYVYIYDGDDGRCWKTVIVDAADFRVE